MQISNQRYIITKDLSKLGSTGFKNSEKVDKKDVFKILDYKLNSHRMRNKDGVPIRSIPAGRVTITIEGCEEKPYEQFYEALHSNSSVQYTLICGSMNSDYTFNNYNEPLILDIYVTNIHEHFTSTPATNRQSLSITVECLIRDYLEFPKNN